MKAVLYIGHGTRTKKGVQELKSFIQRLMAQCDVPIQEYCFLKLTEPPIEAAFQRCVERGATEITVVPLFLLAAGHIKEDIPKALSSVRERYPTIKVKVRNPLGVQEKILNVIEDLVLETVPDLTFKDSILIVGVGGSDPSIPFAYEEIIKGIKQRLGNENISVCYLAAAEPSLQEGMEIISEKAAKRIIVIPYLFFSGQLLHVIKQKVKERQKQGQDIICINPLSSHPDIEEIVLQSTCEIVTQTEDLLVVEQ